MSRVQVCDFAAMLEGRTIISAEADTDLGLLVLRLDDGATLYVETPRYYTDAERVA